jgi:hypothetical protein
MMRIAFRIALSSLVLFAAWGERAFAQQAPQPAVIDVTGAADELCALAAPQVNIGGASNIGSVSGSTVTIAELSDDQTLSSKATDFDVSFAAMCNFDHKVTISSDRGGLWLQGATTAPSGFANAVPYQADFTWAGETGALSVNAASEGEIDRPLIVNKPAFGDIVIHFHVDQGATNAGSGAPLVAGVYEDILRVTLGAQ